MKHSRFLTLLAMLMAFMLVLAACGTTEEPAEEPTVETETQPEEADEPEEEVMEEEDAMDEEDHSDEEMAEEEMADESGLVICQVTDAGGIDDKSFNATAWVGAQNAAAEFGGEARFLESEEQSDYDPNINAYLEDDCDLIVTVGFLLGDATERSAVANPRQKFTIVDFAYDPGFTNVVGQVYNTDEAAFLAGYIAADNTETGVVGTFGGVNIPPVTVFMDGFALGVDFYNKENGTDVQVLGWDVEAQDGLFTGNFDSLDDGRTLGESLMDEGADIIMPVAGAVGLGTAAAIRDRGTGYIVGVDTDWRESASEFSDIILTSVMKRMDISVLEVARQVHEDTFTGGVFVSTLENGGVGVTDGPYDTDISALSEAIINGEVGTNPSNAMMDDGEMMEEEEMAEMAPVKVCQVTDAGGIDDKSFNATAWVGAQNAAAEFGGEAKFLESEEQSDYEPNINAFLDDDCDLIVTVGFLLGDATALAAEANPDQKFSIVDFAYDPGFDNVVGQVYNTDEAAFLAGYIAADNTETGIVGTFGGVNIPPVTVFMDGFALGVQYYNEVNEASVQVLGWDVEAQDGLFTGNFDSLDDGRTLGESLMDEGADIIMPVAGAVGLGTAAAIRDRGTGYIVGVDTDWRESASEFSDIILTSVMKRMDISVLEVARQVADGSFVGGSLFVSTLENGGVSVTDGPYDTDISEISAMIIAGDLPTSP